MAPAKAGGRAYMKVFTVGVSMFTNVLTRIIGAQALKRCLFPMIELNEAALDTNLDMLARDDADPEVTWRCCHMLPSTDSDERHHPIAPPAMQVGALATFAGPFFHGISLLMKTLFGSSVYLSNGGQRVKPKLAYSLLAGSK